VLVVVVVPAIRDLLLAVELVRVVAFHLVEVEVELEVVVEVEVVVVLQVDLHLEELQWLFEICQTNFTRMIQNTFS